MKKSNEKKEVCVFEVFAMIASIIICLWAGDRMPFPQNFIVLVPVLMIMYHDVHRNSDRVFHILERTQKGATMNRHDAHNWAEVWLFPILIGCVMVTVVILAIADYPRLVRIETCRQAKIESICSGMHQEFVPQSTSANWCGRSMGCDISFKCFDKDKRVQQKYHLAPSEIKECDE